MSNARSVLRYDQGFFNAACALVGEIVSRNHLHFLCELDASGMDAVRKRIRSAGRQAPTYTSFVIKAAAIALREHPHLNAMIRERPWGTCLVPLKTATATVAVERVTDGVDMVFAPMLKSPNEHSLESLTEQLAHFAHAEVDAVPEFVQFRALTRLARWLPGLVSVLLRLPALSEGLWCKYRGGSYAVTSPGKYGGCDQVLPPWPWPLTFSFGAIKLRPWVVGDQVVPRRTMRLTITADRRLANGAPLARFAEDLRRLLEDPASWGPMESNTIGKANRVDHANEDGIAHIAIEETKVSEWRSHLQNGTLGSDTGSVGAQEFLGRQTS